MHYVRLAQEKQNTLPYTNQDQGSYDGTIESSKLSQPHTRSTTKVESTHREETQICSVRIV